jgi:adenine C2-methylase RlmN of 23S rRNA A2503 and tRNA A37
MPNSANIAESISLLQKYRDISDSPLEVHYTLIDKVNDTVDDAIRLRFLLNRTNIPVKLLHYSENKSLPMVGSTSIDFFTKILEDGGIKTEYYKPPGLDIGASCGQFLVK